MLFAPKFHVCLIIIACCMVPLGCKKKPPQEGYRVVGYDSTNQHWTILRNGTFDDGKYLVKRLTLVCLSYRWGNHEAITGSDACHLQVGRLITPHPFAELDKQGDSVDVFEMPNETLAIIEGTGEDRISQQFNILKYEVLTDGKSD